MGINQRHFHNTGNLSTSSLPSLWETWDSPRLTDSTSSPVSVGMRSSFSHSSNSWMSPSHLCETVYTISFWRLFFPLCQRFPLLRLGFTLPTAPTPHPLILLTQKASCWLPTSHQLPHLWECPLQLSLVSSPVPSAQLCTPQAFPRNLKGNLLALLLGPPLDLTLFRSAGSFCYFYLHCWSDRFLFHYLTSRLYHRHCLLNSPPPGWLRLQSTVPKAARTASSMKSTS